MSLLLSPMAKNSSAGFYNGVATQSVRLDDGSNAYLHRTPSSAGNRKTWTWSGWLKLGDVTTTRRLFMATQGANINSTGDMSFVFLTSGALLFQQDATSGVSFTTTAVYRDPSAWYNFVLVFDSTDGTDNDRCKIYVNGVRQEGTNNGTITSDLDGYVNTTNFHTIGMWSNTSQPYDGYLSDVNFIDGLALTPTSFGETKNGVWIPINTSGLTFGTNGYRLQFEDNAVGTPENEGVVEDDNIGRDSSGKHNHFTSSGIVASDCAMPDSPENSFCTMNPLDIAVNFALSEGNTKLVAQSNAGLSRSTLGMSTGKGYFEFIYTDLSGDGLSGITNQEHPLTSHVGANPNGWGYRSSGQKFNNTTSTSYGASYTTGDVIGVAFDADNGNLVFYKNNASQGTAFTGLASDTYFASFGDASTADASTMIANFGQDSSFAGNKTAQGNTDGNGIGDFYYEPPSGYLALCTANLPEPIIGANSLTQSTNHFGVLTYTGNDGANRDIVSGGSGVGGEIDFTPDLVWQKSRNATNWQLWFDSVRGATKLLGSNTTYQEQTQADSLSDFVLNGFTVSHNASTSDMNASAHTYVAWNWKANGGTTTTNDASSTGIGDRDSVYQANTTAGFSIVTYTGSGQTGAGNDDTYAHGLQVNGVATTPEVIICKNRDVADAWLFGATAIPSFDWANDYMHFNDTIAHQTNANRSAFSVAPTSTVFSVGEFLNKTNNYVAYLFASVEGYSKFDSYIGNSSADGPFVYTGFRPAFIMVKSITTTFNWVMFDNKRDTFNFLERRLHANESIAEVESNLEDFDFLSNGFKPRRSAGDWNATGSTYIYMAFAETSFKYSLAR
jgi:hypothetical protein